MSLSSRIGGQDESACAYGCNLPKVTIINVKLLQQYVCERTGSDNILKAAHAVCVPATRQGRA